MKRSLNKSALCLSILSMVLGNSAHAGGQQKYQQQAKAQAAAPKQNIKIYFGTMTEENSAGRNTSEIANIQLNVERIDYKSNKGSKSVSCGKSVHFNKDQQDDQGTQLSDVDGLSQINIVLNKNKCGAIRDHRGHQCVIKDSNVTVNFDKKLNFANYENSKLKLFLDVRNSKFEYKKDGSCHFIPKFQVVHAGHHKSCIVKRGCGKGSYKAYNNYGRFVASLRSASNSHSKNKSCKRTWDRDESDAIYDKECQQHAPIPSHTGCGNHPTPPTVPPTVPPTNPPTTPPTTPPTNPPTTPPVVTPPVVVPPVEEPTTPPVVTPPVVVPPVEEPTTPPVVTPPVVVPPVEEPTTPPVVTPPVEEPTTPPVVTPPVEEPTTPPVVTPPVEEPTTPPVVTPPVEEPTTPPVVTPPVVVPPYEEPTTPPAVTGPVISNFRVLEVFFSGVSVSWKTDIASTTQVKITNLSTGVTTYTAVDASAVTNHYMVIEDLERGVSYQFEAISAIDQASTTSAPIFGSTVTP